MTSENAQCSSWCGFWIFKISRKIRVLKQSQSALFRSITHMTILSVFTCVMNVWNQTSLSFVASSCPSGDWSCQFVHGPQDVRSSNSCQVSAFQTICEHTFDNSPTDSSSSFLKWWSSKQGLETLRNCSVFLFANSQYLSTHFLCLGSNWPDGQTFHPTAEGGLLIPVSGVDDAEGRVREQVDEQKIRGNGRNGTSKRDMIRDERFWDTRNTDNLELHVQSSRVKCARKNVRMRACGEMFSAHLPSRSRLLLLTEREIWKTICKITMKGWSQCWSGLHRFPCCYFHFFNADSTDLGLATHEGVILAIDGPRWRTPPRWAWWPAWRWWWWLLAFWILRFRKVLRPVKT